MSSERCPGCGQEFLSHRLYTPAEIEAEFGFSQTKVREWMNHAGLPFRVWYLGRGRVKALIEGCKFIAFLDQHVPEFSEESNHPACRVYRWRRDASRKGQRAMTEARRARKHELNLKYKERRALRDAQSSTPSDLQP